MSQIDTVKPVNRNEWPAESSFDETDKGNRPDLTVAIESILFVAAEPVHRRALVRVLDIDNSMLSDALTVLKQALTGRGIRLQEHEGRVQLVTAPENANLVRKFLSVPKQLALSRQALETLAVVAYCQPVTKSEIEKVRGVNVERLVGKLLTRELIEETGRRSTAGHPAEYSTTQEFLNMFGLSSISELPLSHVQLQGQEQAETARQLGLAFERQDRN